jgi:hypothetical protein
MRKPRKSCENQHALIRTEKIAREARQRSLQHAGSAPRPLRGPPGAPGGRFINTRAFINRRSTNVGTFWPRCSKFREIRKKAAPICLAMFLVFAPSGRCMGAVIENRRVLGWRRKVIVQSEPVCSPQLPPPTHPTPYHPHPTSKVPIRALLKALYSVRGVSYNARVTS